MYARSMLPSVWSSFSRVNVAAFGIFVSGSRFTLEISLFKWISQYFLTPSGSMKSSNRSGAFMVGFAWDVEDCEKRLLLFYVDYFVNIYKIYHIHLFAKTASIQILYMCHSLIS